jgi:hypothetical protein
MNPLVKKEIRLLLPSFTVAVLLALVQGVTRPYDFYVASLLFFGLTIMALTTMGRETSLNTFSMMLAQPTERMRIWQTKLSVLVAAFLIVFLVWLAAFGIAFIHSNPDTSDRENSYNLFMTICLIGTATFTGGLWTTLLLRQLAGAFWLTLLVPGVLAGFTAGFLAENYPNSAIVAALCVVLGVYSVSGFLLARWLFFRAQDVGWSGGIIALPEWKMFARPEKAISTRSRKPVVALFKKEFQLQQISLFGAIGLLGLHLGVIVLRKYHHFAQDSVGEALTSIFWMLWLVMAPVIGSMSVAEERRLGVMEGQLCLPVSRRLQFAIKGFITLFLGIFLGGIMPMLLEGLAAGIGAQNPALTSEPHQEFDVFWLYFWVLTATGWLVLLSFFASTLSRSFLQAVGLGIATFFISFILVVANGHLISQGFVSVHSFLPAVVAVPTIIITLLWLAYLNFKNFRPGWPLWRRNLLGFAGAFVFITVMSVALYNRVWEVFESAEPAHGPAKLSLANPSIVCIDLYDSLIVRLPDGRVWSDYLNYGVYDSDTNMIKRLWRFFINPLPKSAGAPRFIAGSNWVSATMQRVDFYKSNEQDPKAEKYVTTSRDAVGIRTGGTLWFSVTSPNGSWTGEMKRFGNATNWLQLAPAPVGVLLLKNDGTLWRWGTNHVDWNNRQNNWPNLLIYQPNQIGTNSDWKEIGGTWWYDLARKTDGSVWAANLNEKSGKHELQRDTNLDQVSFPTLSLSGNGEMAYVRPDGTLWMRWTYQQDGTNVSSDFVRVGTETNWMAVSLTWQRMIALKSDGSLWQWLFSYQWNMNREQLILAARKPPTRLGIHNDWVALANNWEDVIALAADGSLWLWPDRAQYEQQTLLKLPKQPDFLGNVLGRKK